MYATKTDNFNSTKFDKVMFMNSYLVMGFLQKSPPLFTQYLQHLIPATPQQHPFLWAHLPHMQWSGRPSGLEITISGTNEFPFLTKPNNSVFISNVSSLNGTCIHNCYWKCALCVFLCWLRWRGFSHCWRPAPTLGLWMSNWSLKRDFRFQTGTKVQTEQHKWTV